MTDTEPLRLTRDELREITGTARRKAQAEWLRGQGIPYAEDVHGSILVLRAALHAKLMPKGARTTTRTEPDLSAIRSGKRAA